MRIDPFAQVLHDDLAVNAVVPYTVSSRIVHRELGEGVIKQVSENARQQSVEIQFEKGFSLMCETAAQLADIRILDEVSASAQKQVFFRHFQLAAKNCNDVNKAVILTPAAIEATFSILKLLHADEDRNSKILSESVRAFMTSDRGIPLDLVRVRTHARVRVGGSASAARTRPADLAQVYEFIGVTAPKKAMFLTRTKVQSMAKFAGEAISPLSPKMGKMLTPKSDMSGSSGWPGWRASRVQILAHKICNEISYTLDPMQMARCVRQNLSNDTGLASLFCFSAWLAPFIPDYAEIGAYSKHPSALIYHHAAEKMPKLILEAAFGNVEVAQAMRAFMAQWQQAESNVTDQDLEILDTISSKDRGPFLFWLINERASASAITIIWGVRITAIMGTM